MDALVEAIIQGRLTHRQARIALAVATGKGTGKRRLAAATGMDAADCRRALRELEALGWLPVDNLEKGGESPPAEGGKLPPGGGRNTPQGRVNHPPEEEILPAQESSNGTGSEGRGANHPPPVCSSGNYINTTTTTHQQADLLFPKNFTPGQQDAARRMLAPLNGHAQALLDELAGRIGAGFEIKNPLAYLRGLVRRAKAGDFNPEAGVAVAEARRRAQAMNQARKEAEDAHLAQLKRSSPPGGSLKAALAALRRGTQP